MKGNKGEWSEIYALFKVLSDGVLYFGDTELNRIKNAFYPVLRVIRNEAGQEYQYSIDDHLVLITSDGVKKSIPVDDFKKQSLILLNQIKQANGGKGSFSIEEIESFMASINCFTLKAKSSVKTDIEIVVHDQRTNQSPKLGFSIKSQLGSPSSLLNAGKTTNFIFEINLDSLDHDMMVEINENKKIQDRLKRLSDKGAIFKFVSVEHPVFRNNLLLIDSALPKILSHLLFLFYSSKTTRVSDLTDQLKQLNPMSFELEHGHEYYEYKMKRFLTDIALGMMPSKVWTGEYDATGGYLIVKKTGDVVCYHLYNKNDFERYLLANTKLETPSTKRHAFGGIYEDNNRYFIKLNLQIRFTK